jgi:hypothetical protein
LSELIDQEQRCDDCHNQNKKEGYPESIGPVYLIVGNRTEETIAPGLLYACTP